MNVASELPHPPVRNHVPLSALEMFLALMTLNLTLQPLVEPDFGWHLRAGLDLLNNGWRLPDHDPYSHTMPDWPWVEHAWLTNAILALIYRGLGMVGGLGIIAFFAFLTIGAFLVASARAQAGRSYRLAAITASLWVALPFLGARTQLVSLAGIAIILWLYHRIVRDRPAFLWLYPPVFLLWANLHGGFTAGLFFTGLILAVSLIVRAVLARWPAARVDEPILSWDRIGWLALSLTLSSLLTLVNPYGWRLHVEIYESLTDRFMIETLREWQPFSLSGWAATAYVTYLMTMVGLVLLWYRRVEPIRSTLLLVSLAWSFLHWRNVMIFLVIAVPLLAEMFQAFGEWLAGSFDRVRTGRPFLKGTAMLALAVMLFLLGPDHLHRIALSGTQPAEFFKATEYPIEAVEWIQAHRDLVGEKMYNDYGYGGFLLWWMPGERLFIDGRMPAWRIGARRIFSDYIELNHGEPPALDVLDKYAVEWAVVQKGTPLASTLVSHADWEEIYSDTKVTIVRRRS